MQALTRVHLPLPGALYFVFTIATTIGYGEFAPVTDGGRLFTMVISFVTIGAFINVLRVLTDVYTDGFHRFTNMVATALIPTGRPAVRSVFLSLLSMSVGLGFLFSFGGIFQALGRVEGDDWSYLESLYFGVITLTTSALQSFEHAPL